MLCEIGARVSCEQRGNLWEIITQLHKRIRSLRLELSGSLQAVYMNTFGVKMRIYSAPFFSGKSGVSTLYTPMLTAKSLPSTSSPR